MVAFLLTLLTLIAAPDANESHAKLTAGDSTLTIEVDGQQRRYIVHVPPKYDASKPTPVVIALHGGASNAKIMQRFCGLNAKADGAGFIVVYPSGTGRLEKTLTWNAGSCCGFASRTGVDDVKFIGLVIDDLAARANVDKKRVYATGISNGGMMAYRLAAEMSDRIAAIAPVSAAVGIDKVQPKRPVPVVVFHGTEDEFIPITGGNGTKSLQSLHFKSLADSMQLWIDADHCPAKPVETKLPDNAGDGTTITRQTYGPGKDGAEVVVYTIHGGGHNWPGGKSRGAVGEYLGRATQNLSANDVMWEFLEKHPMK